MVVTYIQLFVFLCFRNSSKYPVITEALIQNKCELVWSWADVSWSMLATLLLDIDCKMR